MSGIMQLLLASRPQAVPDPYFEYTTLLLPGNGTNGAQNNTFLDSSSNAFSITRNGNTTQGTFSPFSQTGWGNYFDGSGDFLQVADAAAMELGSGNWTIEMWVNTTNSTAYSALFSRDDGGVTAGSYVILLNGTTANGIVSFYSADINSFAAAVLTSGSVNCRDGTWHHIAVVRNGNTLTMYIDGTATSTASFSGSFGNTAQPLKIGSETGYARDYTGYISNVRLVVGSAVYTSSFTPSTTPLTAITNTQLLTCQSNRFIDNSSNAFAITRNGDVSVQAFSPFNPTAAWSATTNGGSGYFDGSGDSLTFTDSSNVLDLGGATASVEFWVYAPNVSAGQGIFNKSGGANSWSATDGYEYTFYISGGVLYFYYNNAGSAGTDVSATIVANQWTHVAVATNSSNAISLYINGSRVDTATNAITKPTTRTTMRIANTAANEYFSGYISGLRLISGSGAYDASQTTITVPTAPPTAIANTQLLTNFTNAGIYDATSKNDLETVGNAQISTTQSKFGGSSMYLDGTGDYLDAPSNLGFTFGTGDFTVEFWLNTSLTGFNIINPSTATGSGYWGLLVQSGNLRWNSAYNVTNLWEISASAILNGAWHHVAIARASGSTKVFYDGVLQTTQSDTTNYSGVAAWRIGSGNIAALNGYIDDLRITKGIARYTAAFTPPTAAFPVL